MQRLIALAAWTVTDSWLEIPTPFTAINTRSGPQLLYDRKNINETRRRGVRDPRATKFSTRVCVLPPNTAFPLHSSPSPSPRINYQKRGSVMRQSHTRLSQIQIAVRNSNNVDDFLPLANSAWSLDRSTVCHELHRFTTLPLLLLRQPSSSYSIDICLWEQENRPDAMRCLSVLALRWADHDQFAQRWWVYWISWTNDELVPPLALWSLLFTRDGPAEDEGEQESVATTPQLSSKSSTDNDLKNWLVMGVMWVKGGTGGWSVLNLWLFYTRATSVIKYCSAKLACGIVSGYTMIGDRSIAHI